MSRVGLIFCGWGTRDIVETSLTPWIELRKQTNCVICAVSVRFAGFEGEDDGTREYLRGALERGDIDFLVDSPDNIPEITARSMGLSYLRDQHCDISIIWDSDEVADIESIYRMLDFVRANEFVVAFRFSYRNLVFSPKTWLADPFTPMRVHHLKHGSYVADSFYDDNNIMYRGTLTRDFRRDVSFATMTIPQSCFSPLHHTWLSDSEANKARSKAKIRYQLGARNWPTCTFSWDDAQGGLIFNPALPAPKVISEP